MSLPYLKRLNTSEVFSGVSPWDFEPTAELPENIRVDKKARTEWANSDKCEHNFYSGVEGVNPNLRISKENPSHTLLALIADYDSPQEEAFVVDAASKLSVPPNWIENTLSGNWRFVWLLEKPLRMPSHEFLVHFLRKFADFAFNPANGAIGFEMAAWTEPTRYYTNSCQWQPLNPRPISEKTAQGWMMKASASFQWRTGIAGEVVPLDKVREALTEKYPRFASWPGEFVLGAQGPSFWIPESVSPMSAIVRDKGMQTFSGHASKAFYTWSELIGADEVKKHVAANFGQAVEDVFYDTKHYYRKLPNGRWVAAEKEDIRSFLKIERGISSKIDTSGSSDLDRCVQFVQSYRSVIGAGPFIMRPSGMIEVDGEEVLNTSTIKAWPPSEKWTPWGPEGGFPWLSFFLGTFWDPVEQLDYFLAWLQRFYQSAYECYPRQGQSLFIAGGVGIGKTFLTRKLLAMIVGGWAEAQYFLMGQDNFGSEIFHKPLWVVDDGSVTADKKNHRIFSEMVKRATANRSFRYHAKFRVPMNVEWMGRPVITLNVDGVSTRIIPQMDIGNREKVMLLRAVDKPQVRFPEERELHEILVKEVPMFLRWLLDWTMPEHCRSTETRYGVNAHHEESLLSIAEQSNELAAFLDVLWVWRKGYFENQGQGTDYWAGTAYELHKSLHADEIASGGGSALRPYSIDVINRNLSGLMARGEDWIVETPSSEPVRHWRINKS